MNRIKDLRLSAGMSQAQLGTAIGCVGQTISKIETETRQLDPSTIHALCDLFGCTSDYLLCRSDVPYAAVSAEDAQLLAAYHSAPENVRTAIAALILADSEPAGEKKVS